MIDNRRQSSNFVRKWSIPTLLAATLLANYFNRMALSAFLLFVTILCAASILWARSSLNRLLLSIEGSHFRMFPGEKAEVRYRLQNKKLLPLIWLELYQRAAARDFLLPDSSFQRDVYYASETEQSIEIYRKKLTWILWEDLREWSCIYTAQKRGVYILEALTAASGDGFGLSVLERRLRLKEPLVFVVYPKLIDVDITIFMRTLYDFANGAGGLYEDTTLMKSSRSYEYGDNSNRINWRQLARTGEMEVKCFETIIPRSVFFIIDYESFYGEGDWACDFEDALSVVSSSVVALLEKKMNCGLLLPGYGEERGFFMSPVGELGQGDELLTSIAAIDYQGGRTMFETEGILARREELGQVVVVVESFERMTCRELIEALPGTSILFLGKRRSEKEGDAVVYLLEQMKRR